MKMRFLQQVPQDNRVSLDLKDKKILTALSQEARTPATAMAKIAGLSRDSVQYRINRLTKAGVIQGYRTVIDIGKFGYDAYHLFLRLNQPTREIEEDLVKRFQKYPFARAVITCRGKYDFELAMVAKTPQEFDGILDQVLKDCGRHLQEYDVHIKTRSYVAHTLPPGFHATKQTAKRQGKPVVLDVTDGKVLRALADDPLSPYFRIAEKAGVSHDTVQHRVKRMLEAGVILKTVPVINYAALNYSVYTLLVRFNGLAREEMLAAALRDDKHILWAVKCVGRYNLLMYVCVQNTDELNETLSGLRSRFSEAIMDYEVLIAYEEYKYTYFPDYALL
jgi:DNA-binding Lrp family transcriptional regulator